MLLVPGGHLSGKCYDAGERAPVDRHEMVRPVRQRDRASAQCGNQDLQELLGTYRQVVDRKTRRSLIYCVLVSGKRLMKAYGSEYEAIGLTGSQSWGMYGVSISIR